MKRYGKILFISLATAIVIGAFYIQSSLAANNIANYSIETIYGDEEIGKKINIYGNHIIDNIHQALHVTEKETINLESLSILEQLKRSYNTPEFKDLIARHKNFLRGKELVLNKFYEDEEILAYVDVKIDEYYGSLKKATFDIDVVNKKTKKSLAKKLEVPDKEKFNWMNLRDVQAVNGQLKVFVEGYYTDGGMDFNIYNFSLEDLQLVNTDAILKAEWSKNEYPHLTLLNGYYSKEQENYLLFLKETDIREEDGLISQEKEVIVYSVADNKVEQIAFPESLLPFVRKGQIYDSILYIPVQITESNFEIHCYNLEKKVWEEKRLFSIANAAQGTAPYMEIENGNIYFVYAVEEGYIISISNIASNETLYEGKMSYENQKEGQQKGRFIVHNMDVYE